MKIASVIVGIVRAADWDGESDEVVIGRVAAKLEPIKEALSMMWEDLDMPASEMIEKYEAARAKFEDE